MSSSSPRIGFDRFIHLDWAACALRIRAGLTSIDTLNEMLDTAGLSVAATKKTRTVLNRLWLEPRPELVGLADRGVDIYKAHPDISPSALSWGMAIATYPFFAKVAELMGRLSALQGDCTSAELHRRMSEVYGEREGTYRMTNMVLQSQASWGALKRIEKGTRLIRQPVMGLQNDLLVVWIIEATLRHMGKALSLPSLQNLPLLYPFSLSGSLPFLVANSESLELRSEGAQVQFVALRD
jgi:hypothetical protein